MNNRQQSNRKIFLLNEFRPRRNTKQMLSHFIAECCNTNMEYGYVNIFDFDRILLLMFCILTQKYTDETK